jgi:hypothetical protein
MKYSRPTALIEAVGTTVVKALLKVILEANLISIRTLRLGTLHVRKSVISIVNQTTSRQDIPLRSVEKRTTDLSNALTTLTPYTLTIKAF